MTEENVFNVLIVDDEPEARHLLRILLEEIRNLKVIAEAENVEKALYHLVENVPDLIILDINMPGKTGMDFTGLLKKRSIDVPIIFVSAYDEYAIQSIRNGVHDFLVKPVDRIEFQTRIKDFMQKKAKGIRDKLIDVLESIQEDIKIKINSNHASVLINPKDIVFCQAEQGYIQLQLTNRKTEVAHTTLAQLTALLSDFNFYRLGRSHLVNLDYVYTINKSTNCCSFTFDKFYWKIQTSHKSVKELLETKFNYA